MQIIPAINCKDFECVEEKLKQAAAIFADLPAEALAKAGWVQIDIADGKFTEHQTWNNAQQLREFRIKNEELRINTEVHLMVEKPTEAMLPWMAVANRVILHLEALSPTDFVMNPEDKRFEIGLAINPDTDIQKLAPRLSKIHFVQLLAVNPGKSGQSFDMRTIEKIKFLKKNYPDVIIEVDGGINLETAKLCKDAGADIAVSASYIFDSSNPERAYRELQGV